MKKDCQKIISSRWIHNIPGVTSDAILDELDDYLKNKPDGLIVHVGKNDITKVKNLLNNVKKSRKASE